MTRRGRSAAPLSVAPDVPAHEPDLTPEHKAAVIEALRWAWSELIRTDAALLRTADEESITAKLQTLQDPSPIFQISAAGLVFFAALTLIINARSRPPERPPR